MKEALKEAQKALIKDEVPIGCVIVVNDKIIARGHNERECKQNALFHAEIVAINKACKKLKSWRLENAVLYVTLEPCPMCAGAISNARIKKVVFAAEDKSQNSQIINSIFNSTRLNHTVEIEQGEYEEESASLLTNFFKYKRKKNS